MILLSCYTTHASIARHSYDSYRFILISNEVGIHKFKNLGAYLFIMFKNFNIQTLIIFYICTLRIYFFCISLDIFK